MAATTRQPLLLLAIQATVLPSNGWSVFQDCCLSTSTAAPGNASKIPKGTFQPDVTTKTGDSIDIPLVGIGVTE